MTETTPTRSRQFNSCWVSMTAKEKERRRDSDIGDTGDMKVATASPGHNDLSSLLVIGEEEARELQRPVHAVSSASSMRIASDDCDPYIMVDNARGRWPIHSLPLPSATSTSSSLSSSSGRGEVPYSSSLRTIADTKEKTISVATMTAHQPESNIVKDGKLVSEIQLSTFTVQHPNGTEIPVVLKFICEAKEYLERGDKNSDLEPTLNKIFDEAVRAARKTYLSEARSRMLVVNEDEKKPDQSEAKTTRLPKINSIRAKPSTAVDSTSRQKNTSPPDSGFLRQRPASSLDSTLKRNKPPTPQQQDSKCVLFQKTQQSIRTPPGQNPTSYGKPNVGGSFKQRASFNRVQSARSQTGRPPTLWR